MGMNAARTAMGSVRMGTSAERKWKRKTMLTKLTMMRLGEEVALERVNRLVDQPGAVVGGYDLNAGRQRGRDLLELGLDPVDDVERVHAVAHHHDAADGFAFSLPVGRAAPHVGTEGDGAKIAHQDRRAVLGGDRNIFEIGERVQIAEAADHVLGAIHLQHVSAHLIGALPHAVDHGRSGDAVGEELAWDRDSPGTGAQSRQCWPLPPRRARFRADSAGTSPAARAGRPGSWCGVRSTMAYS